MCPGSLPPCHQPTKVVSGFKADRDEQYREFLDKCSDFEAGIAKETAAEHFTYAELEEDDVDLKKLQGWLEKIRKLDFYGAAPANVAIVIAGIVTLYLHSVWPDVIVGFGVAITIAPILTPDLLK